MKRIGASRRILVAAPRLLDKMGRPTAPADLARFPILHQQEQQGPGVWTLAARSGQRETVELEPRLSTGDFATLIDAACDGAGITLLPQANCEAELASGKLVQVLPEWGVAEGILHLVFTSRRGMLPGVRAVVDFAADALRAAADRPQT